MAKHTSVLRDRAAMSKAIQLPTIKAALESLGLRAAGGNYRAFRQACERLDLAVPQADPMARTAAARASRRLSLEEILVKHSSFSRYHLKNRLLREGVLHEVCALCGIGPDWNGQPLMLHLDHVNGIWNDNRLSNLRIVCPNCHSQTESYCGKFRAKDSNPQPRRSERRVLANYTSPDRLSSLSISAM